MFPTNSTENEWVFKGDSVWFKYNSKFPPVNLLAKDIEKRLNIKLLNLTCNVSGTTITLYDHWDDENNETSVDEMYCSLTKVKLSTKGLELLALSNSNDEEYKIYVNVI
jgi:hypothetical protein